MFIYILPRECSVKTVTVLEFRKNAEKIIR